MAKEQETRLLRINFRLSFKDWVQVVVPDATLTTPGKISLATRLKKTTFQGVGKRLAGNCQRWNNADAFLGDPFIQQMLKPSFHESVKALKADAHREAVLGVLTIPCHGTIGWERTDRIGNYPSDALEEYDVGNGKVGLRVKRSRPDILAPTTDLVTVHYDLSWYRQRWLVTMRAIRMGYDYGTVRALTANSGRVLFDYSHPGT